MQVSGIRRAIAAMAIALTAVSAGAIDVTVNQGTQYQTIEGLGAFIRNGSWKVKEGPFYVTIQATDVGYPDSVIVDAGYSMMRADPVTDYQATQGDYSLNSNVRGKLAALANYVNIARRENQQFRILWSCWSPPPWMKANNSCCQTEEGDPLNYLLPEHYDDYGQHWVELLKLARDTFDFLPYAISLQNEPLFNEPYASCNYTKGPGCGWNGICYNAMFKVAAPIIHAEFPDVKIVASEDLNRMTVENNLRNDAVSNAHIYAWATHNDYVGSFAYPNDRPIWNTEPHANSFMSSSQMIMSNLAAGATMYTEWSRVDDCGDNPTTDATCTKAGNYRGMKMFSRYVRPGAIRVACSGGSSGSYGTMAFYHPDNTCLTVVLINATGATEPANINVIGSYQPTEFHAYQSTNTVDEQDLGTIAADGAVSMPANSVTTLVAGAYQGTAVQEAARPTRTLSALRAHMGPAKAYTLDGRLIGTVNTGMQTTQLAPGVYCTQARGNAASRWMMTR